ncbi:MAG: hypothetical protein M3324_04745 [Actinomycetota bacterium]|nr:hypothetical protein [Actinomycetota bacterium]
MSERRSFWQRLFDRTGTSSLSQRQQKVLQYIIGRIDENVPLQQYSRKTTCVATAPEPRSSRS